MIENPKSSFLGYPIISLYPWYEKHDRYPLAELQIITNINVTISLNV